MRRKTLFASVAVVLSSAVIVDASARAGGLYVPGAGPHAQARAGAFVARADDPTALLHNPAGFAKLDGTHVYFGANLVRYDLAYQRFGSYQPVTDVDQPPSYIGQPYPEVTNQARPSPGFAGFQAIPVISMSTDFGRPDLPLRFGAGVYVPHGYVAREFPERHDVGVADTAPGPQRYDVMEQYAILAAPSIAVAYSPLDNLDVGVRASWGIASVRGRKATWAIRNYEEFEGRDGVFSLRDARDNFIPMFGVGALYRPAPWLELGAAYNSAAKIRARGVGSAEVQPIPGIDEITTVPVEDQFARCAPGGMPGALSACMNIDMPQTASIGGRWILRDSRGGEQADLEVNLRWENWSAASDQLTIVDARQSIGGDPGRALNESINRHGFRDVISTRVGGSYSFGLGESRLILRGGAAYDTAAAPDSWTRVDMDGKARTTLAAGLAFETGRFRFDLGGGVVLSPTIEVEQCQPPHGPTVEMPGCSGTGDAPVRERTSPDPLQPSQGPFNQVESPFNAGRYESGYLLLSAGMSARF